MGLKNIRVNKWDLQSCGDGKENFVVRDGGCHYLVVARRVEKQPVLEFPNT